MVWYLCCLGASMFLIDVECMLWASVSVWVGRYLRWHVPTDGCVVVCVWVCVCWLLSAVRTSLMGLIQFPRRSILVNADWTYPRIRPFCWGLGAVWAGLRTCLVSAMASYGVHVHVCVWLYSMEWGHCWTLYVCVMGLVMCYVLGFLSLSSLWESLRIWHHHRSAHIEEIQRLYNNV